MKIFKYFIILLCSIFLISPAFAFGDISIDEQDGIYHIVLKGERIKKRIKFVASEDLKTNREIHNSSKAVLTVNAGFFDPKNGETISYIVTDKMIVADPFFNESLLANPFFKRHKNEVINRSEFRIMHCGNKFKYDITPHNASVPFECSIETSAQGGPLLYPELRMEEEGFIVKNSSGEVIREAASVLHKVSRTVIGIKGQDECHILIITDDNPMTLEQAAQLCKKLGLDKAMAFDGGSSTSMNYKNDIEVISVKGDGAGRRLKSFMLVY